MGASADFEVRIQRDLERIIIGNWLIGDHLEDLDMFEPYHFIEYGSIVNVLKKGERDIVKIAEMSGVELAEISGNLVSHGHEEAMYEVGIINLQNKLADEWIAFHPGSTPEEIAENMKRFSRRAVTLPSPSKHPVDDLIAELERRKEEKPVTTGFEKLDRMLCGIRTKELTAVGARPSVGKSALLEQIAVKVAKQGKKVLFFPLEMSEMSIIQRMVLHHTKIPQYEMRNGLNSGTWKKSAYGFEMVDSFLNEGNFLIFERCNDIQTIKRLIELHKPYMVAIDQLEQLKDGNKTWTDKRLRFSHMTHEMQAISLDMDVAVWFACQVNRSADNEPPTMANLKESGTIEEDATNVLLLHRFSDKRETQYMHVELAKQKDGECGTVKLVFDAPSFMFYEEDWK